MSWEYCSLVMHRLDVYRSSFPPNEKANAARPPGRVDGGLALGDPLLDDAFELKGSGMQSYFYRTHKGENRSHHAARSSLRIIKPSCLSQWRASTPSMREKADEGNPVRE
jgi:hypothetical protein